tara:strand:+ start:650 stop:922 length:273 start_codon:yes stop_codon:yes gene_type:complete
MKKKVLDSWKRPVEIEATDDLSQKYPEQLTLHLNTTRDATPEEFEQWRKDDYWNRGEYNPLVMMVVIPTLIQIFMLFLMFTVILLNDYLF